MKKKILSLALACLMIMTAFATMVSAETTAPFTFNNQGYDTLSGAIQAATKSGGGTITVNKDYTNTASDKQVRDQGTDATNIKIVAAAGVTPTITFSADNFEMISNDTITFDTLKIALTGKQIRPRGGISLVFKNCTIVGTSLANAHFGYISCQFGSETNSVTVIGGTMTCGGNGVAIGCPNTQGGKLNVYLDSANISSIQGLTYKCDNGIINIHNSTIISSKRLFRTTTGATINVTGNTTLTDTSSTGTIDINGSGTTSIYFGANTKLVTNTTAGFYNNNSTAEQLNIYTETPNFWYSYNSGNPKAIENSYVAPTMIDGASIKIDAQNSGLRFSANFDNTTAGAQSYGMILTKAANLTDGVVFNHALGGKCVVQPATNGIDGIRYNVAICDLEANNYNTKYAARAYATYLYADKSNVTVTVYSAFDDTDSTAEGKGNVRSIQDVADAALSDTKTQKTEMGDGFHYEHKLDNGTYSRYTKEQYEAIKTYASSN
jgi:hypothetical protein